MDLQKPAYVQSYLFLFRSEMTNNRKWEEQGQFVYFCLSKAVNSQRKTPQCWPRAVTAVTGTPQTFFCSPWPHPQPGNLHHLTQQEQSKLIFTQPWHQVQLALECLQAVYYSQRKLHFQKLVCLLQNPLPAQQSEKFSLSAGVYWPWCKVCSLGFQTVQLPYSKLVAKNGTGILSYFSRTCINIRRTIYSTPTVDFNITLHLSHLHHQGVSNNFCFEQTLSQNLAKQELHFTKKSWKRCSSLCQ